MTGSTVPLYSVKFVSLCCRCINSRSLTSAPLCQLIYPFQACCYTSVGVQNSIKQTGATNLSNFVQFELVFSGMPLKCVQFKDIILLLEMVGPYRIERWRDTGSLEGLLFW